MKIHIKNGRLIDPASGTDAKQDVFIAAGKIAGIGAAPAGWRSTTSLAKFGPVSIEIPIDIQAKLFPLPADLQPLPVHPVLAAPAEVKALAQHLKLAKRPLLWLGFFCVLGGLQFLTTGVLAELLIRIYYDRGEVAPYHTSKHPSLPEQEGWHRPDGGQ